MQVDLADNYYWYGYWVLEAVKQNSLTLTFLQKEISTMAGIKPLADRVLVKPDNAEETTASGIIIPDSAKEKPQRGTIVAVGPGKVENGTKIDMSVNEGDKVLYGKYAGTEVTVDNEDYLIMRESDIVGIVS